MNTDEDSVGRVHEVTMENFETVVDTNAVVILDFCASWCQPCKVFAPIFKGIAELNPDVFFGAVNTEVATELAQAFQIRSIPTLMAFKNGELVFEQSGMLPAEQFEALLNQLKAS